MLQFPADWKHRFGVNLTTAFPPTLGGRFRYFERLRPQPGFSAIVDMVLSTDPDFRAHHVGEMLRTVTAEGEYGGWVKIDGRREGSRAMRYIGATFMGDFATALDCVVVVPDKFAEFERLSLNLLHGDTFGMQRRPRPYFYVPPIGWQCIPSGLVANWYPPDFPKNLTTIVVQPATWMEGEDEQAIEGTLAATGSGLAVESQIRDELVSSSGVRGHLVRLQGKRGTEMIYRDQVIFTVHPHAYRMRLETATGERMLELREIFKSVAGSFHPLPSPDERRAGRAFARPSTNLLDYWVS